MKRYEILSARITWAQFLQQPEREKAIGNLDEGDEKRCCLGHGCYCLGVVRRLLDFDARYAYGEEEAQVCPPKEFAEAVGLWSRDGCAKSLQDLIREKESLAELNDETDITPQEIGAYLESVVEGGPDTPFRPLSDYEA